MKFDKNYATTRESVLQYAVMRFFLYRMGKSVMIKTTSGNGAVT